MGTKKLIISVIILQFFFSFISSQDLKIMTYNLRLNTESDGVNKWNNRKDFLAGQLRFYEPDIFGVQEALPEQVNYLTDKLKQYDHIGIGRELNEEGEASSIFYKSDRFKLISQHTFWLSETPAKVSRGWDAACNRVCTYGLFEDKELDVRFWVFNTHLDHMGEVARTKGIELILNKINDLNVDSLPVFLMGDFNSEPTSQRILILKILMDDCREISLEEPFGPYGSFNNFEHDKPVNLLIDYIFKSKNDNFIVQKYSILSDSKDILYPSDHFPVFVQLKYKK